MEIEREFSEREHNMEPNRDVCIEVIKDGSSSAKEKRNSYNQLIEMWENTGDIRAGAYACYYKAYLFIANGKNDKVFKEAMKAITFAKQLGPDFWIEKMSYNLLGIAAAKQGSPLTALNYYMKELSVLKEEKTQDYCTYQLVNANIGCLYAELEDYKKALFFLINAKKYTQKEKVFNNVDRESLVYLNLAECYYRTNQIDASRSCVKHVEKLINRIPGQTKNQFIIDVLTFILDTKEDKGYSSVRRWKNIQSVKVEQELLSTLKVLMDYLEETKDFEKLMFFIHKIEKLGRESKDKALFIQALEYKLKYLEHTGAEEEFNEVCISYYELHTELRKIENMGKAGNATAYISLKRMDKQHKAMEEKQKILKKKTEYDALTNLKNRYAIQSFAKEAFKDAVNRGIYVLVDIIDVDYFKQYNDHYGHISGDRCLTAIAEVIAQKTDEEDLGARYGGDEFLVVKLAKTEEEARKFAIELRLGIMECNILHEYSETSAIVTISQGCFYGIPGKDEILNDFIKEADAALREAKNRKKNRVVMRIRDLESSEDHDLLEESSVKD